jgi:hypothetical protein
VTLSWEQAGAGFTLQSTATLPPTVWWNETNAPAISNNVAVIALAMTANRFYRLVMP